MKKKIINVATCDARNVTEESLKNFESITINAAILITGERSKELLNRYPVKVNAANILEVPDGEDINVKTVNGKTEIGPDSDGTGVFLVVNGKLTIENESLEAVKRYSGIMVNGKLLMPLSCKGKLNNITVNGKTEYYPDGAAIMKADFEVDNLFISRAANSFYYCPGNLFLLNIDLDVEKLLSKGIKFSAKRIIIAEALLNKLVSQFMEEDEIVRVPNGSRFIDNDLELKANIIKKYGTKLCVCGDVVIKDAEALESLEYLFSDGTVSVSKELEAAFVEKEFVCDELKIIDPNKGNISERPFVKIGYSVIDEYPDGVNVEDCAKVILSKDLKPEDIIEKLRISGCAFVECAKEQEEAVNMISNDVAMIRTSEEEREEETIGGVLGSLFGNLKDTQMINAVRYDM